jgi:phage gp29-like protein
METISQIQAGMVKLAKQSRFSPIRTLTPELLAQHLDAFAVGHLQSFALDAQAVKKRDDVISVALPKREKAVSRRGYVIQINDGIEQGSKEYARAQQHQEALNYFYGNLTAVSIMDQDERGGFRRLARQMMEAVGYRYAVHEIVWQPRMVEGKARMTATFNYVPLQFFENTTGKLRFLKSLFVGTTGEEMLADQWIVTVGDGIMEPLTVAWMFKQLALKDWVAFTELLGTPIRIGKTNATPESAAWTALEEAVESIGHDFGAVISEGSSIDFIDGGKGQGAITFEPLTDRLDRAMARICRGADLSTISAGQGSGQGASLQGDESDLLEQDDAAMISETLLGVSRIVIRELFGEEEPLAYLEVPVPKKKNNEDTRKNIELLTARGVPVSQEWVRAELSVPAPAKGEAVLQAPAAPVLPELAAANAAELAAAGRQSLFLADAANRYAPEVAAAVRPFAVRLAEIAALADPAAQKAALVSFRAALPELYRQAIARVPAAAAVLEQVIGTAFADGVLAAAKARPTPPSTT